MRNYIPKPSLKLSLAASFVLLTLIGIFGREGAASVPPASGSVRQQAIPCVFDNFVWFKDQEIIDEIRKDVPS